MMFRRTKKSQAAMEFLMTYGWAIMAAAVVIGALMWLGVFNVGNLVPDSKSFADNNFQIVSYQVTGSYIIMEIENNYPNSVTIKELNITPARGNSYLSSTASIDLTQALTSPASCNLYGTGAPCGTPTSKGIVVGSGEKIGLKIPASITPYKGKQTFSLLMMYYGYNADFATPVTGTLTTGFTK